jgi:hypothetical protein
VTAPTVQGPIIAGGARRAGDWSPAIILVCVASVFGLVAAYLFSPLALDRPGLATITYAVLVVVASAGIFWGRLEQIQRSRRAQRVGAFGLHTPERIALWLCFAACFGNAISMAIQASTWDIWPDWLTSIGR